MSDHTSVRADRRRVRAALVASLTATAVYLFISLHEGLTGTIRIEHIDLNVYRLSARVLLEKGNLYGTLPPAGQGIELPFTYPPIAAVLLAPLAVLPPALDAVLSICLTVALLAAVQRMVLGTAGAFNRTALNWATLMAMPAALIMDPVRVELADGQIDVVLMALVVWDTLGGGLRIGHWRPRGALVGLAAAVKLTPAVFVLYFLARGERRATATAGTTFAAFTGLGAVIAPHDSARYWGRALFQTDRIGAVWYAANQSLDAVLARSGLAGRELGVAWVISCVAVVALTFTTMRRAAVRTRPEALLLLNALAGLLISPISWTHHWVWIVPGIVAAGVTAQRTASRALHVYTAGVFLVFAIGPQWFLPHDHNRELHWGLWEQAIGDAYVWIALATLILTALCARTSTGARPSANRAPEQVRNQPTKSFAAAGSMFSRRGGHSHARTGG